MTDTYAAAGRSEGDSSPGTKRKTRGSHRRRNLVICVILACLGLYAGYAGRRTPVALRQGTALSWPQGAGAVTKARFRIATYNIHRGKGTDGIRDLGRTAGVLQDADLIGLNEVAGSAFWGWANQAEQLGRALGLGWQFAPNQRRWHRDYFGNGLLSRFDVGRWTSVPLVYDRAGSHSPRNLFTAEVLAGPASTTFLVTHLDRGAIRPAQLKAVLGEFVKHTPAALVGDFNTSATDPLLVAFFADANNVDAIGRVLGRSDDPDRIDWIITRGLTVLTGGKEPVGVSDHPYYWVDVAIEKTGMME
ncbi:MAG: endonuclease/exonuclease/phosphatase family protein [Planctomycetes bacterium]|jgi:endonuclease/exonuclease/phosphatase family metal-dependent hydrolase|nr:endonuclease/exonuclease/phosphatase family protein [Planctomycetota bacterium]